MASMPLINSARKVCLRNNQHAYHILGKMEELHARNGTATLPVLLLSSGNKFWFHGFVVNWVDNMEKPFC